MQVGRKKAKYKKPEIALWVLFIISSSSVLTALVSIIYGSQPCSGDGCIIHILQFIGLILLLVFGPICWLIGRKLGFWSKGQRP